jgi:hypothetical protein
MLKWYKKLYTGDNVKKNIRKIIWKVNHGRMQFDIYLVTRASNPENLLEIISAKQLLQKNIRRLCPEIVGVAGGYEEAVELVRQIVEETYHEQGDMDVRRYLCNRQQGDNRSKAGD